MIFDRLSEAIVLLAAMFTVAWMQRNNEILPLLSAGISTRRVVQPVLIAAFAMVGLAVLNQEMVLPTIDPFLVEFKADGSTDKEMDVKGGFESNGIHISGKTAHQKDLMVKDFTVVFPNSFGFENLTTLQAKEAYYLPPEGDIPGCWKLVGTTPPRLPPNFNRPELLRNDVDGRYYLTVKEIDFMTATRPKNWAMFVPTMQLLDELGRVDQNKKSSLAVMFHMRLTRPALGILLVFMGLSVILRDQNRNIFISAGLCLMLCVTFFLVGFACKYLGDHDNVAPLVAAWMPVLLFGPLSLVMFDAVHT